MTETVKEIRQPLNGLLKCVICLETLVKVEVNASFSKTDTETNEEFGEVGIGTGTDEKAQSLHDMCHLLKIDIGKLFELKFDSNGNQEQKKFHPNPPLRAESPVECNFPVCKRCSSLSSKFMTLHRQRELIRFQMLHCLEVFEDLVRKSELAEEIGDNQDPEFYDDGDVNVEPFQEIGVVSKFRQTFLAKCSARTPQRIPKVIIKRLKPDDIVKLTKRLNSEHRNGMIAHDVKLESVLHTSETLTSSTENDNHSEISKEGESSASPFGNPVAQANTTAVLHNLTREIRVRKRNYQYSINKQTCHFQCNFCSAEFPKLAQFFEHFASAHKSKQEKLRCGSCKRSFRDQAVFAIHKTKCNSSSEPTFGNGTSPPIRSYEVPSVASQRIRNYCTIKGSGRYICGVCNKEFAGPPGFYYHFKSIHLGLRHKCEVCSKLFRRRSHLDLHQRTGACPAVQKLSPTSAEDTASNDFSHSNRKNEKKATWDPETRKWKCCFCQKRYLHYASAWNHVKAFHIGQRFKRDGCGREFKFEQKFRLHKKYQVCHHETKNGSELVIQQGLRNLNRNFERNTKQPRQQIERQVENISSTPESIPKSKKISPPQTQNVPCAYLKERKLWKCDLCRKQFGSLQGWDGHKKAVHLGIRPKCARCGKSFWDRSNLLSHVRKIHGSSDCTANGDGVVNLTNSTEFR